MVEGEETVGEGEEGVTRCRLSRSAAVRQEVPHRGRKRRQNIWDEEVRTCVSRLDVP